MIGLLVWTCLVIARVQPAEPTIVRIERHGVSNELQLSIVASRPGGQTRQRVVAEVPSSATSASLSLAAGEWDITCRGNDVWCPNVRKHRGDIEGPIELAVFRSTELHGQLSVDADSSLPGSLTLEAWSVRPDGSVEVTLSESVSLDEGRFSLRAPRGRLDLRLASDGFAPVYLWNVDAGGARTKLPTSLLRAGSSLSGFVFDLESSLPVSDAEVVLTPLTGLLPGASGTETSHESAMRLALATRSNEHGFFQLAGISAGRYKLEAAAGDRLAPPQQPIEIQPDSETNLAEPLLLRRRLTLTIQFDPPMDPDGGAWGVEAFAQSQPEGPALEASADDLGVAQLHDLDPGTYEILISSASGSLVSQHVHSLDSSELIPIEIDLIRVEGLVRLGKEPLSASLALQTGGGDSWNFESDEEGRFRGGMSPPERHVLIAHVRAEQPQLQTTVTLRDLEIEHGVLRLELDLPNRELVGVVRNANGEPVADAEIVAESRPESVSQSRGFSGEDGSYRLGGLSEQPHSVQATHVAEGNSEVVTVEFGSSTLVRTVDFVLLPRSRVDILVRDFQGQPVPGASVEAYVWHPVPTVEPNWTDETGKSWFELPSGAKRMMLTVLAPSHGLWFGCLDIVEGEPLALSLPAVGGTLELQLEIDPDTAPPTAGETVLLAEGGGFVNFGKLLQWTLMSGLPLPTPGAGLIHWQIPALAAGAYALLDTNLPWWSLAERACLGLESAEFELLPADGSLQLFYRQPAER